MEFKEGKDDGIYGKVLGSTRNQAGVIDSGVNNYFRTYPSLGDSFADNGRKLRYGVSWVPNYYSGTWLENAPTYQAATAALQAKETSDNDYAKTLNTTIEKFNLTRFDPKITNVNENMVINKNTVVYDTFSGAGQQIGTVYEGQIYKVTSQVKMANGFKFNEIGTNRWVRADTMTESARSFVTIRENGVVRVSSKTSSISVLDAPGGLPTGQSLKPDSKWRYTGKAEYIGQTWYQVGSNQWVSANEVVIDNGATPTTSTTPTKPIVSAEMPATGVIMINYISGFGVRLFDGQGAAQTQLLQHGTHFKLLAKKTINGQTYYKLGNDKQWIPAQYAKFVTDWQAPTKFVVTPNTETKVRGILRVKYVANFSVRLIDQYGKATDQLVEDSSHWKFFAKKMINDNLYYRIGNQNQWIAAKYIIIDDGKTQIKPAIVPMETPSSGVIEVNYVPGYGVRLFDGQGTAQAQLLQHGTHFKVLAKKTIDGQVYYKLGNDKQWIPAQYAKFVTDWQVPTKPVVKPNTETKISGVLQVKYVPNFSVRLVDQYGKATDQMVKDSSNWKFFAKKTINGNVYYSIGNQNQWIAAKYMEIAEDKVADVSATPIKSAKAPASSETKASGVIVVNYVPGYGVRLFDDQGTAQAQLLQDGSHVKVSAKKTIDGQVYYKLGNDKQWIQAKYVKFVTDWKMPTKTTVTPNQETKVDGELQVNYVPNYSVCLHDQYGKAMKQLVKDGTHWRFFAKKTIDGKVYYRIGNQNQWILAKYIIVQ